MNINNLFAIGFFIFGVFVGYNQVNVSKSDCYDYPDDPIEDIEWMGNDFTVEDLEYAFNNARNQESIQLGISLPEIVFPDQTTWDNMSDNEQMLWLLNEERTARGLIPFENYEENVTGIAQYYAQYLIDNDAWGHDADGNNPWDRLYSNEAIGNCHDFIPYLECNFVMVRNDDNFYNVLAHAVYFFMYTDDECCSWVHRHSLLWDDFNDNSGEEGSEGFLGVGHAYGTDYTGSFSQSWEFAQLLVLNMFDPCENWEAAGIQDYSENNIVVYPNPAQNYINFLSDDRIDFVKVFDNVGNLIFCKPVDENTLDISTLNKGMFFIVLQSGDHQISTKLFVD